MDAYPGGQTGVASLRFKGSGAYAHLNLAGEAVTVPAGARGTWTVAYQPDAWPIQPGGSVTIWKWGPKFVFGMALQDGDPSLPDYCSACVEDAGGAARAGVRVELTDLTPQYKRYRLATLVIREAPLAAGKTVCFVAGDTSRGAPPIAVPAYTAAAVAIDVQIDHDGDGHPEAQHRLWIDVVPDRATRLRAVAPSTVAAGDPFSVRVLAEDTNCNVGAAFTGEVHVCLDGTILAQRVIQAGGADEGRLRLDDVRLIEPGVHRLDVVAAPRDGAPELRTQTNPIRVLPRAAAGEAAPLRVYWGEMHNHTTWCEGMGTVDENYRFARDDARLDFYSASEHIMLGPGDDFPITDEDSPMASSAAYWRDCQEAARRYHVPGAFVTYIGYEWTALLGFDSEGRRRNERQTWGDHCAWFLRDDHPLVIAQSIGEQLASLAGPAQAALAAGERPPGMIIPHPGGGATDWTHYAGRDLVAMPLVETCSQHAHTEWFYQRAIETGRKDGFKLGVCGMDDGHMGHPGYDVWSRHGVSTLRERAYSVQGGLTAALAPELTREAVWDAFFDRRTYATSGERMLLDFWAENADAAGPADPRHVRAHRQASNRPAGGRRGLLSAGQVGAASEAPRFRVQASGTAPLDLVEIIRDDRRVQRWVLPPDTWDVDLTWVDAEASQGEATYYVRVTQTGDAFAWSSPIWLTCTAPDARPAGSVGSTDGTLPAWNEGAWPPEQSAAACAEAAAYVAAVDAHLTRYGASGRYVDLHPVGIFREHRGRYALFRGRDATTDAPVQLRYYPDFSEDRIRVAAGVADYGAVPRPPRTAPGGRPESPAPSQPR